MAGDGLLDGLEREVAVELEKRAGPAPTRGIRIPSALFKRQISTDPGSVAALSPTQYVGQLLDDTSAARKWGSLLQRCGFVQFNSTRESVSIPKRDSRIQASWGPKDTDAQQSDWTTDDDVVSPRYVKSWVPINRSALKYADPSALQLTLSDLGDAIDDAADTGLFSVTASMMCRPACWYARPRGRSRRRRRQHDRSHGPEEHDVGDLAQGQPGRPALGDECGARGMR